MKAVFKKAFHFTLDKIEERQTTLNTRENIRIVAAEIRTRPGLLPQEVPDWVKDTDLFKIGVSERSIVEV